MRLLPLLMGSLLLGAVLPAQAMPAFAREYKQQYGYMPSCNACHTEGGGTALNGYGKAFKEAGKTAAAFAKIATADSDGDGGANAAEAQAKANPGDKASTLKAPGNWLDMASLIPKEVQARFPGILTWMPRDAILTPADIAAAKAMGATLGAADENTIYVPVKDQRPAGTALIFPVTYQGKTGFLLMTTDRTLKITGVSVLHADKLPAAKSSKVYASFNGLPAQAVPVPKGSDLDAAIATAVKNAGVLLYVRLKGA
ncbi:MAG TPA: hypothetical protein VFW42_08475 [Fluviicoccus sp.]|nr:hypothetical protein [Fluviicoccus sp.]